MAMDVFERLNRKFGVWYEGLFGGGNDSRELRPRDILRRILAAMEDNRREGLDGQVYVPNVYTLQIAVDSDDERQYLRTFLDADELAVAVKRAADQHGYGVRGPLVFAIEEVPDSAAGARERVRIQCRFDAQPAAPARTAPVASVVEMPHVAAAYADDGDDDPGTVPAVPAATLASLVVRAADGRLHDVFPLTARGARVGRGRNVGNDIVLAADGMVSKSHARIVYDRGEFCLFDENSTNGTFVNGRRLRAGDAYTLQPGDEVKMGETVLLFRPANVPPPAPSRGALPAGANVPLDRVSRGFRLVAGDGEAFVLASEMTVGRSLTGDIVLIGNGVAGQHARLSVRGDSVYLEDSGTPGGTFVNGERIPARFPVALYDGDQVGFGEVLLRLERMGGTGNGGGRGLNSAVGWAAEA
jgi:pSer/pThr/pTyr-binding forkhead associated (FHA) protein